MEPLGETLSMLLGAAWLLPLASFALILFFGPRMGKSGVLAGYVATGAILTGFVLSLIALVLWLGHHGVPMAAAHHTAHEAEHHDEDSEHADAAHEGAADHDAEHDAAGHGDDAHHAADHDADHESTAHHAAEPPHYYAGNWYSLFEVGSLAISIGYHIDALTIAMFTMVTLIATCIHFYATGYMHEELHDVTDHEVTLIGGGHLHRAGRYPRFFQYLSLFCFSMLGLVIAGNVAMVFVFWELVGICSYFLIGFYIERKSASNAANKAFIVNRVGDFGMIIGLMALWGSLGTFTFGDIQSADGSVKEQGIFSQVRSAENDYHIATPDGMVKADADVEVAAIVSDHATQAESDAAAAEIAARLPGWREQGYGRWLLIIAGLGIFCGCVGKSAQFPLHVWLPDAMEGPTPVSALVHSATMVAAGVYLVGRFFPAFTPEVLMVIAYVGAITLFLAATIAITATDIKRVLAYSTVSQLGYMMLALGVGGWLAGLYHLFTHAFFKSLLFLCSGSVIHACHTNEMPRMGGLRKKMPWTAYTMLVGCLAIAGAGLPFAVGHYHIGMSGYYSKDAIISQAMWFADVQPRHAWLFYAAAGGAAITAFYMFRLWYMTFAGKPRDQHVYDHAHESPRVMYLPLVVLAVFAAIVAWPVPGLGLSLEGMLTAAVWPGTDAIGALALNPATAPDVHSYHAAATLVAGATALAGFLLATVFYGLRWLNPNDVRKQFATIYRLLLNKWWFDELYDVIFVRPVHFASGLISNVDRKLIDRFIDRLAAGTRGVANVDDMIDRYFVDGLVNLTARWTYGVGVSLRTLQTGKLRQYVMLIVVGTVVLFVMVSFYASWS